MSESARKSGKRSTRRYRTLFMSIAVTFLVICALLTASSLIRLERSTEIFRREQHRVGIAAAAGDLRQVRNQLREYMQLCDLIAADSNVQRLPESLDEPETVWIPQALAVRSTLLSAQANFGDLALQEVLAYYPAYRTVVTGRVVYTRENLSYFETQRALPEDFWDTLERDGERLRWSGDLCWITRAIYRQGTAYAYVLLGFRPQELFERVCTPQDRMEWRLGEACVWRSGGENPAPLDAASLPDTPVEGEGTPWYAAGDTVKELGLTLLGLRSAEASLREIGDFHRSGLVQILVSLLVIVGLGFLFTYRIYLPIRRLLTNAMVLEENPTLTRAMETVGNRLQSLSDEKERIEQTLQQADYLVQGQRLRHILQLPDEKAEEAYRQFLRENRLDTGGRISETPIQYIPTGDSHLGEEQTRDQHWFYSLSYMLLSNTMNTKINFLLLRYGDAYVLLTGGGQPGVLAMVQHAVAAYTRYLAEYGVTGVMCAATMPVGSARELRAVLGRIPQTMENLHFYQGQEPSAARAGQPFPSLPQLHALTRLLETGKREEARQLLLQLLDQLFAQSSDRRWCIRRVHGLLMVVMTALQRGDPTQTGAGVSGWEERIASAVTVEDLRAEAGAILTELLSSCPEAENSASANRLFPAIQAYLEQNYMDHDLNMSALSAHFGLNESTISRVFRQERNMTFLEYLQALRVQKAKEWLKTGSVKDTAQQVGFWDTQALIRVFKKYEGITPGQYKELLAREQDGKA